MDAEAILLALDSDVDADDEAEGNPEELVDHFRQFLESIKPEDFGA
jgi:hypothetical protein